MDNAVQTLEQAIAAIPGDDGWWSSGSEKVYVSMAKELMGKGFTQKEAVEFLTHAYVCAARCFGV